MLGQPGVNVSWIEANKLADLVKWHSSLANESAHEALTRPELLSKVAHTE
jgi:hypothetical protein